MKKRNVVVLSILLVLLPVLFFLLKGMYVPFNIIPKSEVAFCPPPPVVVNWVQPKDRKLIKTGTLSFECEDLNKTRSAIETAVKQYGGFVMNEQLHHRTDSSGQDLTIRVPFENFDALISGISQQAQHLDRRDIRIEDVTERYFDTETRLSVKRQVETRYRELLGMAKNVKDILAIEEQLAILRENIEGAEAQLKRLDDQVALSTLDVSYYVSLDDSPRFSRYFQEGIRNGWEALVWMLIGLLNIWPFILIVILLIFGFRFQKNRHIK